ncbi:MAG: ECF transporter S component [Firmicutes bacterium]|nr:ECF transporter S component [Bacillota bacterium]
MARQDSLKDTRMLVTTGLMLALTTIATTFLKIPVGAGYIHLGDVLVLLAARLLPKKNALLSASLGAALADLLGGFAAWAPFTLVIKAGMVLLVDAFPPERGLGRRYAGLILAGVWTVAGYYLAEGLLYANWLAPLIGVPFNALQVAVGAVLSGLLYRSLKDRIWL